MTRRTVPAGDTDRRPPRPRRAVTRGAHAAPRSFGATRALRLLVGPAILAVLTVGVVMLGAFPARTLLDQRHTLASAEAQLEELDAANTAARAQADALRTDAKVEELARREYGYARPGDELYHVLPPAQDPVRVPEAWPFTGLGPTIER